MMPVKPLIPHGSHDVTARNIDDATGIVAGAHLTKEECTAGHVEALRQGVERYGLSMKSTSTAIGVP